MAVLMAVSKAVLKVDLRAVQMAGLKEATMVSRRADCSVEW